jgi:biotin synthase
MRRRLQEITMGRVEGLLLKLYRTNNLEKEELITVLRVMDSGDDSEDKELLFALARKTRYEYYGNKVYLRGIVEFSNYCKNTCRYCGIRAENKKVCRYRMSAEKILDCCEQGYALGYRTFVLQSGEDGYYDDSILADIAGRIKERYKDAALTFSIGERSEESYKKLKEAGADRYLLRHETADSCLYESLHPGMSLENRLGCLHTLKKLGYQAGAGFIVGLPGQDVETIADDILFLKALNPHMAGIGPFIAHPNTPLGNEPDGSVEKTLVCLALIRLFRQPF